MQLSFFLKFQSSLLFSFKHFLQKKLVFSAIRISFFQDFISRIHVSRLSVFPELYVSNSFLHALFPRFQISCILEYTFPTARFSSRCFFQDRFSRIHVSLFSIFSELRFGISFPAPITIFSRMFFPDCVLPCVLCFSRIVFCHFFPAASISFFLMFFPELVFQCLFFQNCILPFFPALQFFPKCFFQNWFFNIIFSELYFANFSQGVFCQNICLFSIMFFSEFDLAIFFLLPLITSFFQYVFSRIDVSWMFIPKCFFAIFFLQPLLVFFRMFFPELVFQCLFFQNCILPFFPAPQFFPKCFFQNWFFNIIFSELYVANFSQYVFCQNICLFSIMFFSELDLAIFFLLPLITSFFQYVFSSIDVSWMFIFLQFFSCAFCLSFFLRMFFPVRFFQNIDFAD